MKAISLESTNNELHGIFSVPLIGPAIFFTGMFWPLLFVVERMIAFSGGSLAEILATIACAGWQLVLWGKSSASNFTRVRIAGLPVHYLGCLLVVSSVVRFASRPSDPADKAPNGSAEVESTGRPHTQAAAVSPTSAAAPAPIPSSTTKAVPARSASPQYPGLRSLSEVCAELTTAICDLCGRDSRTCSQYRESMPVLAASDPNAESICTEGVASIKSGTSKEKQLLKSAVCEAAAPSREASSEDCPISLKLMCELCGQSSDACRLVSEWVRLAKPSAEECRISREGMEATKRMMERVPPDARRQMVEENCAKTAEDLAPMANP
jgi:hypothetical protein